MQPQPVMQTLIFQIKSNDIQPFFNVSSFCVFRSLTFNVINLNCNVLFFLRPQRIFFCCFDAPISLFSSGNVSVSFPFSPIQMASFALELFITGWELSMPLANFCSSLCRWEKSSSICVNAAKFKFSQILYYHENLGKIVSFIFFTELIY